MIPPTLQAVSFSMCCSRTIIPTTRQRLTFKPRAEEPFGSTPTSTTAEKCVSLYLELGRVEVKVKGGILVCRLSFRLLFPSNLSSSFQNLTLTSLVGSDTWVRLKETGGVLNTMSQLRKVQQ